MSCRAKFARLKQPDKALLTRIGTTSTTEPAQAGCQVVTISTANHSYAAVTWPKKPSRACTRVAANGVIIEHRRTPGWEFVTVGSSFQCPIKGVPTRVAHDLGVCT
jgi:hypothetical protein